MSTFKSPFAFLGRSAASDDDTKDDKNKSKSKAEEKDDDEEDKKDDDAKSKKAKAEDGDDDDKKKKKDDDEDEDEDDDKAKSKKGAKSKADDDEDDTSASAKAIRARERSRIRAILTSEAGQADPVAAAHVALDTAMPRAEAIGMLTAMSVSRAAQGGGAPARAGLGERMGGVKNPDVGGDGGSSAGPSMADRIILAGKKARGEA